MSFSNLLRAVIAFCFLICCPCFAENFSDDQAVNMLPDSLVQRIPTDGPGVPIIVFNPLSWPRTDIVEMDSPFDGESPNVKIIDSEGSVYPARSLGDSLRFTARNVPALGYRVYWIIKTNDPVPPSVKASNEQIENQYFRITLDTKSAAIKRIYDKANRRDIMPAGSQAAVFKLLERGPCEYGQSNGVTTMMDSGPARGMVVLDRELNGQPLVQELALYDGVPRIDIRLTMKWSKPMGLNDLYVSFPISLPRAASTSGCEDITSDSRLAWADAAVGNYGVSIVAKNAYGCEFARNMLMATMAGSVETVPITRDIRYSIVPHIGELSEIALRRQAFEIGFPLIARTTDKHPGILPRRQSLLSWASSGVIAAIYLPDSTAAQPQLRIYNILRRTFTINVKIGTPGLRLIPADAEGKPVNGAKSLVETDLTIQAPMGELSVYRLGWEHISRNMSGNLKNTNQKK